MSSEHEPTLHEGQLFAKHYRIARRIGAGGMGEVFEAIDTRLDRTVAIKLLPEEWADDPDRRRRFLTEARAASALDHPAIVGVHDIAEADGRDFLVMQFVRGRTLRELLAEGSVERAQAMDFAVQLAEGLAEAHDRGVIHRDLKPENIMVTERGRVKILDFGLAKRVKPETERLDEHPTLDKRALTQDGQILGTPNYMSPEQAQGFVTDARSDVFSFGSVVYELLSGKRAFEADTTLAVLTAIARDDPTSLREQDPTFPAELAAFVERTLRKAPDERFATMRQACEELVAIQERDHSPKRQRDPPRRKNRFTYAVMAVAVLGATSWTLYSRRSTAPDRTPMRVLPLTAFNGSELSPSFSPSGDRVAFAYRPDGARNHDIYVMLTDGGRPLLLSEGGDGSFGPIWTPDGTEVTFLRDVPGSEGHDVLSVPALGGTSRRLTTTLSPEHGLSYSPDGKLLALVDEGPDVPNSAIFLFSMETGERKQITFPPEGNEGGDWLPAFSPDGERIAFQRGNAQNQEEVFTVTPEGEEPTQLTFDYMDIDGITWTPDSMEILFASTRDGPFKLWRMSADGGEPFEILEAGTGAREPNVALQGNQLAFRRFSRDRDIWRATADGIEPPAPFIASTQLDENPAFSPDGSQIAFTSYRSGFGEIWLVEADGSEPTQLTSLATNGTGVPFWSRDGRNITFTTVLDRQFEIYTVGVEDRVVRRLTNSSSEDFVSTFSADGEWVYFSSNRSGDYQTWKVPAGGGDAVQVTTNGGGAAFESPDGRSLYYTKVDPDGLWRLDLSRSEETKILDNRFPISMWRLASDGSGVYFYEGDATAASVHYHDFETATTREVAQLGEQVGFFGIAVSPVDGSILYVKNYPPVSDLILIRNFR